MQRLLEGGANFKIMEMDNIKCQNLVFFFFFFFFYKLRMKRKFSMSINQI